MKYPLRLGAYLLLFGAAATLRHRGFHLALAVANPVYHVSWVLRIYDQVH